MCGSHLYIWVPMSLQSMLFCVSIDYTVSMAKKKAHKTTKNLLIVFVPYKVMSSRYISYLIFITFNLLTSHVVYLHCMLQL